MTRYIYGADDPSCSYYDEAQEQGAMPLPTLVDTVLLKAYLLTDASLVMPFLGQRNECHIEECQVSWV